MALQKMIRIGNSWAITIPKSFLDETKTFPNKMVEVNQNISNKEITLGFGREETTIEEKIDKEIYTIGKKLLKHYLPAFKELAQK